MKLERTLEQYANCTASGVAGGSKAQMMYFVEDAKKDIATLAEERDRIERNRDMWKGQVERQAQELERLREALSSIEIYGSDTLSGPTGGVGDRDWYRDGVREMRNRARAALPAPSSTTGEAA